MAKKQWPRAIESAVLHMWPDRDASTVHAALKRRSDNGARRWDERLGIWHLPLDGQWGPLECARLLREVADRLEDYAADE